MHAEIALHINVNNKQQKIENQYIYNFYLNKQFHYGKQIITLFAHQLVDHVLYQ